MKRIGIDIGATLTKVVEDGRRYRLATGDPAEMICSVVGDREVEVRATGCMAMTLPDRLNSATIVRIPEFEALAVGGRVLSGLKDGVMATVGTGTSIIRIGNGEHLGGTGVGCGTLLGLARAMIGVRDPDELSELAQKGDPAGVNLLVGDICPLPIGHLLESVTASNMARLREATDVRREDIAAGIYSLVGEVVATVATYVARSAGFREVIYAGGGIVDPVLRNVIQKTTEFWGLKPIFVDDPIFVGAIGAYYRGLEP